MASQTLGAFGNKEVTPLLIEKLNDESHLVRVRTIIGLGLMGDRRAVKPLIKLLDDEDEALVSNAITSLGCLGDPEAVVPLLKVLETKKKDLPLSLAMEALGQIGDVRAVEPLLSFVKGRDEYLAMEAGEGLARIGQQTAISPLKEAIGKVKDKFVKKKLKESYQTLSGEEYPEE